MSNRLINSMARAAFQGMQQRMIDQGLVDGDVARIWDTESESLRDDWVAAVTCALQEAAKLGPSPAMERAGARTEKVTIRAEDRYGGSLESADISIEERDVREIFSTMIRMLINER